MKALLGTDLNLRDVKEQVRRKFEDTFNLELVEARVDTLEQAVVT